MPHNPAELDVGPEAAPLPHLAGLNGGGGCRVWILPNGGRVHWVWVLCDFEVPQVGGDFTLVLWFATDSDRRMIFIYFLLIFFHL